MILPYGYTSENASYYGLLYNSTGILGALLTAVTLQRRREFKSTSVVLTVATLLSLVVLQFCLSKFNHHYLIALIISLNGLFSCAAFPLVYEWAAEMSPEISESISSGAINTGANMLGLFEILCIQSWTDGNRFDQVSIVTCVTLIVSLVVAALLFAKVK